VETERRREGIRGSNMLVVENTRMKWRRKIPSKLSG